MYNQAWNIKNYRYVGDVSGRRALAKFMAVTHRACNAVKMTSMWGTLTVKSNAKYVVACVQQVYIDIVVAVPVLWDNGDTGGSDAALRQGEAPHSGIDSLGQQDHSHNLGHPETKYL